MSMWKHVVSFIGGRKKPPIPKSEALSGTKTPCRQAPNVEASKKLPSHPDPDGIAGRAIFSVTIDRAASSFRRAVDASRSSVESSFGRGNDAVKQSIEENILHADALRRSASNAIGKSAQDLAGKLKPITIQAKEELYRKSSKAKEQLVSQTVIAVESTKRDLSQHISATINVAREEARQKSIKAKDHMASHTDNVIECATSIKPSSAVQAATNAAIRNSNKAAQSLIREARDTRDRVLKWLWWWGLAAVGVYGLATTLPRELIKYYASEGSERDTPSIAENNFKQRTSA